jgi:hypothetical protein
MCKARLWVERGFQPCMCISKDGFQPLRHVMLGGRKVPQGLKPACFLFVPAGLKACSTRLLNNAG